MKKITALLLIIAIVLSAGTAYATPRPRVQSYMFFESIDDMLVWFQSEAAENFNRSSFVENVRDMRSLGKVIVPDGTENVWRPEIEFKYKRITYHYTINGRRVYATITKVNEDFAHLLEYGEAAYFRAKYDADIYEDIPNVVMRNGDVVRCIVYGNEQDMDRRYAFIKDGFEVKIFSSTEEEVKIEEVKSLAFKTVPLDTSSVMTYADVNKSDWFYHDVEVMKRFGILEGVAKNKFAPNEPVTWATAMTAIWRIKNNHTVNDNVTLEEGKTWYSDAVKWVGTPLWRYKDPVNPNEYISRQDFAALLAVGFEDGNIYWGRMFSDEEEIAEYAKNAVLALSSRDIIQGKDDNRFDPHGILTRAELAAMIHRWKIEPPYYD